MVKLLFWDSLYFILNLTFFACYTYFASLKHKQDFTFYFLICIRQALYFCKVVRYNDVTVKKGRYLTQSYDKSPYTDRKIQKATSQYKKATKHFDYTTIADRLRTVSWGNDRQPNGVVKPVTGSQPSD